MKLIVPKSSLFTRDANESMIPRFLHRRKSFCIPFLLPVLPRCGGCVREALGGSLAAGMEGEGGMFRVPVFVFTSNTWA